MAGRGLLRSLLVGARQQFRHETTDPLGDFIADPPHRLEVLARRVLQLPVLVALAGVDRARVAAAHRDHDVG